MPTPVGIAQTIRLETIAGVMKIAIVVILNTATMKKNIQQTIQVGLINGVMDVNLIIQRGNGLGVKIVINN
jgi:hypothetical protein